MILKCALQHMFLSNFYSVSNKKINDLTYKIEPNVSAENKVNKSNFADLEADPPNF